MFFRAKSVASIVVFATLLFVGGSARSRAPWFGTWKLSFAKSNGFPSDYFKEVITRIEPAGGGLKVVYETTSVPAEVTHMEWIGKLDGQDRPFQSDDNVFTHAYSRIDERSYQILVKFRGVPATTVNVARFGRA